MKYAPGTGTAQHEEMKRLYQSKPASAIPYPEDIDKRLRHLHACEFFGGLNAGLYQGGFEELGRLVNLKHELYMATLQERA